MHRPSCRNGIRRRADRFHGVIFLVALTVGFSVAATPAAGQVPGDSQQQQLPEPINAGTSHADVVEALRSSGLTRSQLRSRLQQMGYDPAMVDRYYDLVETAGNAPLGEAPPNLARALSEIGVVLRPGDVPGLTAADSMAMGFPPAELDTLAVDSAAPGQLPIFGMDLFKGVTTQFQAVSTGPVDPDYRLGPGDQLYLIVTGDVETALTLEVTREGYIFIPDVGQVLVNGLTMRELENRLYERLGQVYSGAVRGPAATTQFQATLGQLRSNLVYVIGEVERPGAYQVSSVGTVFSALYAARGPNENGSFRRIEVRRGGQVYRTIDIYDYLLAGDSSDDIRLEQGDILFVPVVGPQVGIQGAVRRSALFELLPSEGLQHLLGYAGRLEAEALLRRVQIDRIVPPDDRSLGVDRVLVDVDVQELLSVQAAPIPLRDGDLVQVFSVSGERRNRLVLTGEVRRPGVYEWLPGTTIWDAIQRAEGLQERAYTPRAHIFRMNEADGTRTLLRTPLLADGTGQPLDDVPLADLDSVVVYSQAELRNPRSISIEGFVQNPGSYTLADGMTVEDLVLAAGGFIHGADLAAADVARMPINTIRTDTTAQLIRVSLRPEDADLAATGGAVASNAQLVGAAVNTASAPPARSVTGTAVQDIPFWLPRADEFALQHGDIVYIRKAPGYEPIRQVSLSGQIVRPGMHVLETRQDRLTDVIERSGGLTAEAYPSGLRLFRQGHLLPTDVERALADPNSRYNVVLEAGDSIHIPEYDPTVLVTGAVAFESRVLYAPGQGLDYYIGQAGGYLENADEKRATVTQADGERGTVRKFLLFTRKPEPEPGSMIHVPTRPMTARGIDVDQLLTRALSIASVAASVIIAVDRVR
jgi:polysaccharide biosynthesis/export protein